MEGIGKNGRREIERSYFVASLSDRVQPAMRLFANHVHEKQVRPSTVRSIVNRRRVENIRSRVRPFFLVPSRRRVHAPLVRRKSSRVQTVLLSEPSLRRASRLGAVKPASARGILDLEDRWIVHHHILGVFHEKFEL